MSNSQQGTSNDQGWEGRGSRLRARTGARELRGGMVDDWGSMLDSQGMKLLRVILLAGFLAPAANADLGWNLEMMKKKYGKDRSDQKYIYSLFPTGLIKCANKVAGLPRPKGCS